MKSQIIALSVLSLGICFFSTVQAGDRCPAGETSCTINNAPEKIQERVNEGAKNVLENTNPSGRVKEVQDTVKECFQCGAEALKDGFGKVVK